MEKYCHTSVQMFMSSRKFLQKYITVRKTICFLAVFFFFLSFSSSIVSHFFIHKKKELCRRGKAGLVVDEERLGWVRTSDVHAQKRFIYSKGRQV